MYTATGAYRMLQLSSGEVCISNDHAHLMSKGNTVGSWVKFYPARFSSFTKNFKKILSIVSSF